MTFNEQQKNCNRFSPLLINSKSLVGVGKSVSSRFPAISTLLTHSTRRQQWIFAASSSKGYWRSALVRWAVNARILSIWTRPFRYYHVVFEIAHMVSILLDRVLELFVPKAELCACCSRKHLSYKNGLFSSVIRRKSWARISRNMRKVADCDRNVLCCFCQQIEKKNLR